MITERALAKINLALHVRGRRDDGYHDLDSIVAFADIGDVLTFTTAARTTLSVHGAFAEGLTAGADNLILRAAAALSAVVNIPATAITLEKNLPVASGIGGGSADAAATLRGLIRLADARIEPSELDRMALALGADVPVCLRSTACRMTGIGDEIFPIASLPQPALVLANPMLPCATAAVFAKLGLRAGQIFGTSVDLDDPATWRNDLELPALAVVPLIGGVLAALRSEPLLTAVRMSGSGATCFGLAQSRADAEAVALRLQAHHPGWWVRAANLL